MRGFAFVALTLALGACTPNGTSSVGGGSGGGPGVMHVIAINLTLSQPVSTKYGQSGAFTPAILNVKVGDTIVFKNTDSFGHTASIIPVANTNNETRFPSAYPWINGIQQSPSGSTLSGGWTSGVLQAGATSQVIHADKAGTYLYGCQIHYGAPMRGAIVAQ